MNPTGGPDEAFISSMIAAGAVLGLIVTVALGALCAYLASRAVSAVPVEQRKIQPKVIWGILAISWVFMLGSTAATILLSRNPEAGQGLMWGSFVLQILVGIFNLVWVWRVGLDLPRSFQAAFETYDASEPASDDRGRGIGRWMIAMYTISGVLGLVLLVMNAGTNPIDAARAGLDPSLGKEVANSTSAQTTETDPDSAAESTSGSASEGASSKTSAADTTGTSQELSQEDLDAMMASVPQLVLSCGAGLFSLVYVILLIIFFVTVLRQRRELLELQYHDTHPSHDSGDSTVPRSAE